MSVSTATIEEVIRDEIRSAQADRPTPKAGWEPQVDSLVMISIALRIEEEFNVKLPEAAMPPGGFNDENTCVAVFTQRVVELLEEQQAKNQTEGEQVS
ncbi:acyl carrier protein [Mesorhizobium sp. M0965]|uniref:acyl carrier protein n=1 Tax=unclassified Mesorhizobium TaxID=325217 RepID=UPI00333CCFCE